MTIKRIYTTTKGYRKIVFKGGKEKYVHRYRVERAIGRKLKLHEKVHHINGNIKDNRKSNLALCLNTKAHKSIHKKQRPKVIYVLKCQYCGKRFKLMYKSSAMKAKFCSRECSHKGRDKSFVNDSEWKKANRKGAEKGRQNRWNK